jgi:hypothetical protein
LFCYFGNESLEGEKSQHLSMLAFCFGALENIKYFYVLPANMSSKDAALMAQPTSIKIGATKG